MSQDEAPTTEPEAREQVAKPAGLVSLATMCSRVTGLLREAVFAALFATGPLADAFNFAFRIPNLLRDFFAEGALSSAFVPTFAEVKAKEGEARAFELARRVFGTLGTVAAVIVLLGILFAPAIVSVVAVDAPAETRAVTEKLTRIMFPFLAVIAVAAVAMGILNTYRRYFVPALAPMFFNLVSVTGGVVMLLAGLGVDVAIMVWAVLVVAGGLMQFLVQVPLLRSIGLRGGPLVDLRFRDPALRRIVRKMGPVVISLAGTNIMLVITTALASRGEGWASTLNYAFRLIHLPIGIVGVAVGTIVLTAGARRRAADDHAGVNDVARKGLRLNWFLALPSAVGLFVLAEPLVQLIYERGRFGGAETENVAEALRWYASGVVFYAGIKAAAPLFIAHGDTRTPMYCSLLGIGVNLIVALTAIDALGFRALALAVAAGTAANYLAVRFLGVRRFGPASGPGYGFLLRVGVASAVMGGAGWLLQAHLLSGDEAVASGWALGALTLLGVVVLSVLYFLVCGALRVEEGAWVRSFLRRRGRP